MSAYGGKADNHRVGVTSALPPIADISRRHSNVRFVPIGDITFLERGGPLLHAGR
jgi:hypothetical protein